MVSVVLMLCRMAGAIKYAVKEERFGAVVGAAVILVLVGTVTYSLGEGWRAADGYSLGEGWRAADGFYFAVCTLTTSSIADPNRTLAHEALKIFTAFYVLTGIGILVESARQLGVGYIKMREAGSGTRSSRRHREGPPETPPAG
jgi:hypothetical protein